MEEMEEVKDSEVVSRWLRRDAVVEMPRCGGEPKSAGMKPALHAGRENPRGGLGSWRGRDVSRRCGHFAVCGMRGDGN